MQSQALHFCLCRVKVWFGGRTLESLSLAGGFARTAPDVRFLFDLPFITMRVAELWRQGSSKKRVNSESTAINT